LPNGTGGGDKDPVAVRTGCVRRGSHSVVERDAAREAHRADASTEYMSGSDGVPSGNR
jgi:hypothetical protein